MVGDGTLCNIESTESLEIYRQIHLIFSFVKATSVIIYLNSAGLVIATPFKV